MRLCSNNSPSRNPNSVTQPSIIARATSGSPDALAISASCISKSESAGNHNAKSCTEAMASLGMVFNCAGSIPPGMYFPSSDWN